MLHWIYAINGAVLYIFLGFVAVLSFTGGAVIHKLLTLRQIDALIEDQRTEYANGNMATKRECVIKIQTSKQIKALI
jgi:hypothetical protein